MVFLLFLLSYLAPETLNHPIRPLSSLLSSAKEADPYRQNDPSALLLAFSRELSTCTCPPPQRSMWDIIWSCLAVILACAWVSVHPDVPAPDEKWWRDSLRRIEYLVWTFLTPEMIVWWAARQWMGARKIQKEQKDRGWTITHAHFIQMGGFMLFKGKTRMGTISYPKFLSLLERRQIQFPDITEQEIADRSKSDALSKTLVIAQTGWFIMQCIARGVRGLPISELELLTLALAALNGIMYFFWWNKPFGVQCPFPVHLILPTDSFKVSAPEPRAKDETMEPKTGMIPDQSTSNDETMDQEVSSPEPTSNNEAMSNSQDQHPQGSAEGQSPKSNQSYTLIGVNLSLWKRMITWPWAFAVFVAKRLGKMIDSNDNRDKFEATLDNSDDTLGFMRVPIFYSLDVEFADEMSNSVIPLIGTLFGAIHCAAWAFRFPTTAELWLWRLSSIIITVTPLSIALLYVVIRLLQRFSERTSSGRIARTWLARATRTWSEVRAARTWLAVPLHYLWIAGVAVLISPLPLYIMARLILLAESISTLRDLPPGAFDIVQWTSFLPHI